MLTLHYLTNSRAQRVAWLLEEIGIEYELKVHRRLSNGLAPPIFRQLHPLGKAPLLQDGELVLAESAHIVEHIIERYAPQLRPPAEQPELARDYRYWLHFAEASFAPPLIIKFLFDTVRERTPALLRPLTGIVPGMLSRAYLDHTLARHVEFVDEHLRGREFFVGEALSGADVMMIFPCEAAAARFGDRYGALRGYVARIHARPAYAAVLERSGVSYRYA